MRAEEFIPLLIQYEDKVFKDDGDGEAKGELLKSRLRSLGFVVFNSEGDVVAVRKFTPRARRMSPLS
jgi:hypothetical protein